MKIKKVEEQKVVEVEIKNIEEPEYVARTDFERAALKELEDSIETHGLIQPIVVKRVGKKYEIVAGHRRFLATRNLKNKTISCLVVEKTQKAAEFLKLDENIKRQDLNDIEEAYFYEHLKKIGIKTSKELAAKTGRSEAYIMQKLQILKYPDFLFAALKERKIAFSAARELIRIDDMLVLKDYVEHAVRSGLSTGVAKQWADDYLSMKRSNELDSGKNKRMMMDLGTQRIKLQCYMCENHFLVEQTEMIRVCEDDLKIINKAKNLNIEKEG